MRITAPLAVAVLAGAVATGTLKAQSPAAGASASPAFEVASVKENRSGDGQRGAGFQPGGRFRARNMTARGLIAAAYGTPQPLPVFRVVGGPAWIDTTRFDIEATASREQADVLTQPGWSPRGALMLRALLADRFKLRARQETRDVPAFTLVLARRDGVLGPQLRPSTGLDCADPKSTAMNAGTATPIPCGGFRFAPPERLMARYLTMDDIARFIMLNAVERPVVNRTGLSGYFSMDLDFTRDLAPAEPREPGAAPATAVTSIFTAVTEQLGLRLESTRAPLDVVVVDAIEGPSPD